MGIQRFRTQLGVLFDQQSVQASCNVTGQALAAHETHRPALFKKGQVIFDKILVPSKLKFEVRVDELQQPFIWISSALR